ncbi:MAG TPA: hypothetical protein VGG79_00270 [Roseiarcus sp.]|jgi:hypothetical protein
MLSTWKYALFLALTLPVLYAFAPLNIEDLARPRWLDSFGVLITKSLASVKPEAVEPPVDPVAAANVDEDLDYRIAQRKRSSEGWRAFLTAHPDGPHAQSVRAELGTLAPSETPPAPAAVQTEDARAPDPKTSPEVAALDGSPAQSEAAASASDEICKQDEDRLEHLSDSPTADGVIRFLIELRCEKLRPQLVSLAERVEDKAPPAAANPDAGVPSSVLPEKVVSSPPLPPPRMRANEHQKRTPTILSSRGVQRKRHAKARTAPNLPQLLLALFGEGSRNSTAVRRSHGGGSGGGGN